MYQSASLWERFEDSDWQTLCCTSFLRRTIQSKLITIPISLRVPCVDYISLVLGKSKCTTGVPFTGNSDQSAKAKRFHKTTRSFGANTKRTILKIHQPPFLAVELPCVLMSVTRVVTCCHRRRSSSSSPSTQWSSFICIVVASAIIIVVIFTRRGIRIVLGR